MNKKNKIITTIICISVVIIFLLVSFVLPYLFVWIGLMESNKDPKVKDLKWDKLAVKTSIYTFQKTFTIQNLATSLLLAKQYDENIKYLKKLEKLGVMERYDAKWLAKSYLGKQDYKNALKYAEISGMKIFIVEVLLAAGNYDEAETVVNEILKNNIAKQPEVLDYDIALIAANKGDWNKSKAYISKYMQNCPNNLDGLKLYYRIQQHFGEVKASQETYKKISEIKQYRKKYENVIRYIN